MHGKRKDERNGVSRAKDPRQRFLKAALEIFLAGGLKKLTFDAVASKLGVSKQAVIHWFPTKTHLVAALLIPALRGEAQTVLAACARENGSNSLKSGLLALAEYHLADLERFRMIYLAPQSGAGIEFAAKPDVAAEIHAITSGMYRALAGCIRTPDPEMARLQAVSLHAAVIGVVTMIALGRSVGDPMKHGGMDQVRCLIERLGI
ncbi:TetR/AcrR family transcriptional regulator [Roseibium sp.]